MDRHPHNNKKKDDGSGLVISPKVPDITKTACDGHMSERDRCEFCLTKNCKQRLIACSTF